MPKGRRIATNPEETPTLPPAPGLSTGSRTFPTSPLSSLSLRCVELVETSKRTLLSPRPFDLSAGSGQYEHVGDSSPSSVGATHASPLRGNPWRDVRTDTSSDPSKIDFPSGAWYGAGHERGTRCTVNRSNLRLADPGSLGPGSPFCGPASRCRCRGGLALRAPGRIPVRPRGRMDEAGHVGQPVGECGNPPEDSSRSPSTPSERRRLGPPAERDRDFRRRRRRGAGRALVQGLAVLPGCEVTRPCRYDGSGSHGAGRRPGFQQTASVGKPTWVSPASPRSRRKRRSEFLVPYDGSGKSCRCLPFSTPFLWRHV